MDKDHVGESQSTAVSAYRTTQSIVSPTVHRLSISIASWPKFPADVSFIATGRPLLGATRPALPGESEYAP